MSGLDLVSDHEIRGTINIYKQRVEAMQITLHMSAQKAGLVLTAKKLDEVPRLRAIQKEMDETVVLVQALYKKVQQNLDGDRGSCSARVNVEIDS